MTWLGIDKEAEALVLGLSAASTFGSTKALAERYVRRAVAHGYYTGLFEETQGEQPLGTALRYGQAIEEGRADPMATHATMGEEEEDNDGH